MSVEAPRPVPRKRNVVPTTSSSSATRSGSVSGKDLEVRGLRGKLDEMSMQQLRDVLEDAAALHSLISSLQVPQLDSVRSNRDAAAVENRRLAEQNLETKPELEEMRNELTSVESTMRSLMDTHTQYYDQLSELLKRLDNQRILSQLQRSVSDLESQTEGTADNFLAGKMNEEQFMDQYMLSRISYWKRKVKAEKMEELLNPAAPKVPPRHSQPPKPSPYRTADIKSNSVQTPAPSQPMPSTQTNARPPPTQHQAYQQPTATQPPPYRPAAPPVSAATQAAPYPHPPPTQYQAQRPQYQPYPQQQRPPYQPYPQQYQPPPGNYQPRPTYQPPGYPQQAYAGYQQPRPTGYYYQQRPPYGYR